MTDIMIDLETLGTSSNAAVVQIGACFFNRATGEIGRSLRINVRPDVGVIDSDSVMFWLSQSKGAQNSILAEPRKGSKEAFEELNKFIQGAKYIWSHATFDFVILTNTLRVLGIKPMFRYQAARDIRTLQDLAGYPMPSKGREGVHHDALDDCKFQVAYCVAAFNALAVK